MDRQKTSLRLAPSSAALGRYPGAWRISSPAHCDARLFGMPRPCPRAWRISNPATAYPSPGLNAPPGVRGAREVEHTRAAPDAQCPLGSARACLCPRRSEGPPHPFWRISKSGRTHTYCPWPERSAGSAGGSKVVRTRATPDFNARPGVGGACLCRCLCHRRSEGPCPRLDRWSQCGHPRGSGSCRCS